MSYLKRYHEVPASDAATRVALVQQWLREDTRDFFAELRDQQPVFRTPAFTLVTRHRDVVDVLSRNDVFSVRIYQMKMDDAFGPYMLGRDESVQNYRDKALMQVMMSMDDLDCVGDITSQMVERLLPCEGGPVDVVQQISRNVPVGVCGEYFGFPGPDQETMKRWGKDTQADFFKNLTNDPVIHANAVSAGNEMKEYLRTLVEHRRTAIQSDPAFHPHTVVDRLVSLDISGHLPLNSEELIINIGGLLVGTVETTSQAIAQALEQILRRPAIHAEAIELAQTNEVERLSLVVREALRFHPINPLLFRFTESRTIIGAGTKYETQVEPGEMVFACTASAMLDESVVDRSDEFLPGRPKSDYLSFGHGVHECLGKWIGEIMMTQTLRVLLTRQAETVSGPEGLIDFKNGPFPESYSVLINARPDIGLSSSAGSG